MQEEKRRLEGGERKDRGQVRRGGAGQGSRPCAQHGGAAVLLLLLAWQEGDEKTTEVGGGLGPGEVGWVVWAGLPLHGGFFSFPLFL